MNNENELEYEIGVVAFKKSDVNKREFVHCEGTIQAKDDLEAYGKTVEWIETLLPRSEYFGYVIVCQVLV